MGCGRTHASSHSFHPPSASACVRGSSEPAERTKQRSTAPQRVTNGHSKSCPPRRPDLDRADGDGDVKDQATASQQRQRQHSLDRAARSRPWWPPAVLPALLRARASGWWSRGGERRRRIVWLRQPAQVLVRTKAARRHPLLRLRASGHACTATGAAAVHEIGRAHV